MGPVLTPIPDSVSYIEEQLRLGRGLAQLSKALDLSQGSIHAFLPESSRLARAFDTGALRDDDDESKSVRAVAEYLIAEHGLTEDDRKVLICQFADGARIPPGDPSADSSLDVRYRTVWLHGADRDYEDGELWYVDVDGDVDGVVEMLREALWFPALALLIALSAQDRFKPGQSVDYRRLASAVPSAEVLLCGAWDATNYLLWRRENTPAARGSP